MVQVIFVIVITLPVVPAHLLDPLRGLQCAGVSEALLPGLQKSGPQLHPEHVHVTIRRESTETTNVRVTS